MKKIFFKVVLLFTFIISVSAAANAQFIVKIRPNAPVIVRGLSPSPRHSWVEGEWIWRGGRYQYVNGYWAMPPRYGVVWIPGHWKNSRRGWVWRPGHWRR